MINYKIVFFLFLLFFSCSTDYIPKPKAYLKLDLPDKNYEIFKSDCPFFFDVPTYSSIVELEKSCMFNIEFENQNGRIHVTYYPLSDNLVEHTEESRRLAYKHNTFADAINERLYINRSKNVYGILYDYKGLTATAMQFYITDSINHFFRGALYFDTEVNDSITPINNFIKQDIKRLIESFSWKEKQTRKLYEK